MPPHHTHKPPPPPHVHVSSSAISAFIEPERIEALLAPLVPEPGERAFVVRCLLGEGPAHHRGANYVLLALLGQVLEKAGGALEERGGEALPVPMRLPPHLAREGEERHYPLGVPVEPLERLAPRDSRHFAAMVDCLTDGPPQHALANAAMVALLGQVLARLEDEKR